MNCWAVQKLLALYVGESDLPIGSKTIKRHLKNCSACNQVYQKYLNSKKVLEKLKHPDLPEDFFSSSWEKIYSEISQSTEIISPEIRFPSIKENFIWKPVFAVVLFSLGFFLLQENFSSKDTSFLISPVANTSSFFNKEKISIPSFPYTWEENKESFPIILQSFTEYHLEQVKPLETQDASF